MNLDKLRTRQEVEECVDMYMAFNQSDFMEASRNESIKSLWQLCRLGKFVRCVRSDTDKILAWLYADTVRLLHCDFNNFQQVYYASDQHGVKAFKCIKLLHDSMFEYACEMKVKYCVSPGSHFDEGNTFARCLERQGWSRRGFLAVRPVPALG